MSDNWTIEDIKGIEVEIASNTTRAAELLILGVEAKFYRVTGDKTAPAWIKRVLDGSGFTFSRKSVSGELSARDAMIVTLIKDDRTIAEIADALGIGLATVHAVKKSQGVETVGGSKRGAGRASEAGTPSEEPGETDETSKAPKTPTNPINTAMNAIDKIKADNRDDEASLVLGWTAVMKHLMEVSGLSADELAALAK